MENDLLLARKNKMDYIVENHVNPYPDRFDVNEQIQDAIRLPDGTKDIRIAGRIILMRKMGNLSFARISDIQGSIQIAVKKDVLGSEQVQ